MTSQMTYQVALTRIDDMHRQAETRRLARGRRNRRREAPASGRGLRATFHPFPRAA